MSYNPYGGKYTYGGTLKHYRRAISDGGSPNGYRKDGSQPTGKKRMGRIVGQRPDGTLIYEYPTSMGQRNRNSERLRTSVTGEDRRGQGGDMRTKMASANPQRVRSNINKALEMNKYGRDPNTIARSRQRDRVNSAIATNAGARGISSREEQQRKGNRINANLHGNTFGNKIGNASLAVSAKGHKAVNDTKKFVKDTAKNAPNIFQRGASAIGDWFSKRRAELKTTGKNVGNWLKERGKNIRDFGKTAYDAISNSDEREAYERAQANFRKNPTAENRKARDNAKRAYDSHLLTRLDRGVKGAPGRISKAAKSVGKSISNQDEREAYERANANYRKNPTAENRKARDNAKRAYDSHLLTRLDRGVKGAPGRISKAAKSVGKSISNQDEREAYERANANYRKNPTAENRKARDNAKRAYDSHLLTRLDRGVKGAPGRISKAANQVGDFASNTASNAKDTATKIATYATERAKEASNLISKLPSSAKSYYEGLIDNIKNGKTKSEIDAALIELQNNINNAVYGPSSMPSDSYLDKIDPVKKKKK